MVVFGSSNLLHPTSDANVTLCCALQPEKVTVVFPMRYKDSNDVVLATSFLQVTVRFLISNGILAHCSMFIAVFVLDNPITVSYTLNTLALHVPYSETIYLFAKELMFRYDHS